MSASYKKLQRSSLYTVYYYYIFFYIKIKFIFIIIFLVNSYFCKIIATSFFSFSWSYKRTNPFITTKCTILT